MTAVFQDGHHGLYWTTTLCLKVAADSQKMILGMNDMYWTLRIRIWFDKKNRNVQMFTIWLPFNNIAAIDNDK